MGLFWSMLPEPNQMRGLRLMKRDVTSPYDVELAVFGGHFNAMDSEQMASHKPLAITTVERWYLAKLCRQSGSPGGRTVGDIFHPHRYLRA